MTNEQLAERLFPHDPNAWGIDFTSVMIRRSDFIKGLEVLEKYNEWLHNHKDIYAINNGLNYRDLPQLFLTEKYGNEQQ